jgi:TolA-binding protein
MSLSESASAQVQAILEAAEASAEQIKREAKEEAGRIRKSARETRQADVSSLVEMIAKVRADLDALEARLRGLEDEEPAPAAAPAEAAPVAAAPKEPAKPKAKAAEAAKPAAPAKAADGDEAESARLIALNMALNGEPREATDKYLADNYDLDDRAALLDEVYASV